MSRAIYTSINSLVSAVTPITIIIYANDGSLLFDVGLESSYGIKL
jgi:hypothetical protein